MKATKQPKDASVNVDVAKSRVLQSKRDLAWTVYCAVHDELEAYELAERRGISFMKDVARVAHDMHSMLSDLARTVEESRKCARDARARFDRISKAWAKLDSQAQAAGLPDPADDFAVVLERINRTATLRLDGDALKRLSDQLSDMSHGGHPT